MGLLGGAMMAWVALDIISRFIQCAVERRRPSAGANPARQQSLQPVAIGAVEGGNDFD